MVQPYIGASITRKEDQRFLTGQATFADDVKLPGMLHATFMRSPHAHARLIAIDTTAALAIPGVVAVYTYDDISGQAKPIPVRLYPLPSLLPFLQYPLANDKVRYVGDPVAIVVAESRYVAEDALDVIDVTYEQLPAVLDMEESLRDETIIHEGPGTNLAAHFVVSTGDIDQAFRDAEYTRKERFKTNRHTGNPLETRGIVASYNAGELTVWGATKVPHFNREVLSSLLDLPEDKMHFIEGDVGGGFGIRGEFYPEDFLVPFAVIKLGRPIKWMEDRLEHLIAANHSRDVLCDIEIAMKKDGSILGIRAQVYGDMGGYIRTHGSLVPASTAGLLMGPYNVPAYQCGVHCVMTNKTGVGTFRAPGRYESCFIRERLLDMAAADLGIDPAELRFKNLVQPSQMPYNAGRTRADGDTVFDSGNYPQGLTKVLEQIGYDETNPKRWIDEAGRYHGIGIATYVKNTGRGPYEGARIVVNDTGQVAAYLGITTMGQGHETTMAQICADSLGVTMDVVTIFHGNTDYIPFGGGTYGSRGTVMGGNAVHLACQNLKKRILNLASTFLDTEPANLVFQRGEIFRKGEEQGPALLSLGEIAGLAANAPSNEGDPPGLETTAYFEADQLTFSYGSHAAHVAVDPETGKIEILRYVVVEDIGRAINPLMVHGQAVGGAAQGIGATLLEELVYDNNGQLLAGSFMDYLLPTSTDVPPIESIVLEEAPSPLNPLGVKGAGEGGIVATGATLANAVSNALAPLGVQVNQLPLSPDFIARLIRP
ncbi:MAG: xanthine dehydrogenase family protein molybdopterin-binding subunit [Chloroflexota bacterium]|nr:xanthine dehydrogenase family protein molybdopterin-binding subunit [Chloroflexota bacterium]